jgi:hypothetical protein
LYDQLFFHDRRCKKSHAAQQAKQQPQTMNLPVQTITTTK